MSATVERPAHERALDPFLGTVDSLWACLAPGARQPGVRRILFTSARRGQGTTTIAACAAVGLARHLHARVAVIEAGSPSSALASLLGVAPDPGISDFLARAAQREDVAHACAVPGLRVVPAGQRSFQPGAFTGDGARALFAWLAQSHDFVLLDVPPVHEQPEMRMLLAEADQAVVVAAAGRARRDEVRALTRALENARLDVLGCVLNEYRPDLPDWLGGS